MATRSSPPSSPPRRRRTAWHPLFVRILRAVLPPAAYEVLPEYLLGAQPQRLDVVIVRKEAPLAVVESPVLRSLLAHLGEITLIEFKGPTASLERDDLLWLLGYAAQYCAQNEIYDRWRVSLLIVAGRLSAGFRDLAIHYGAEPVLLRPGVHRLTGLAHAMHVIETEEARDPTLRLFAPSFLRDPAALFSLMNAEERIIFGYVFGEVERFRRDGSAALRYADYEEFAMSMQEFIDLVLDKVSKEDILRHVSPEDMRRHFSPEERLKDLSPEERLKDLSPEDVQRLSPEARERLRNLLSH